MTNAGLCAISRYHQRRCCTYPSPEGLESSHLPSLHGIIAVTYYEKSHSFNSYPAMRLLARYCYSALCTRARYRLNATFMLASHRYYALCTQGRICNNSHCSCPLHRAECFCSAIESTIACIRLSALDYASLYTTVRLDFLE